MKRINGGEKMYKIENYEVKDSEMENGYPFKNKLPEEIKNRLLTKNQWLEMALTPKAEAKAYKMYANRTGHSPLYDYYLDTDVEPLPNDAEVCATCEIRCGKFCDIAGEYINMTGHCSEWTKTKKEIKHTYEKARRKINDAINEAWNNEEAAQIIKGRRMSMIKCPKCGYNYASFHVTKLTEEETGTRQGGYLLEVEYECGCPPFRMIVAEHKGQCVMGQIVDLN